MILEGFPSPKVRNNWIIRNIIFELSWCSIGTHSSTTYLPIYHQPTHPTYTLLIPTYLSTYLPNIHTTHTYLSINLPTQHTHYFWRPISSKREILIFFKTHKLNWFWRVSITKSEKQLNQNKYHIWSIKMFRKHTCHICQLPTYLSTNLLTQQSTLLWVATFFSTGENFIKRWFKKK